MGFSLQIRDMEGKRATINIPPKSSVQDLITSYSKHCGYPVDSINLLFRGKALKNDENLSTIPNLAANSTVIAYIKSTNYESTNYLDKVCKPASPNESNSQTDVERMKLELEKLRLEDKAAERRHELERLKLQHEFEIKKLEIELQKKF